jgi:hypothetical protein
MLIVPSLQGKTLPFPTQAGQVGGHEGVGKIVKMGPGTDNAAVKLGDRVGIKWMAGICESCDACRAGIDASCFSGVRIPIHPNPLYQKNFSTIYIKQRNNETLTRNSPNRKSQATTLPAHSSNTSVHLQITLLPFPTTSTPPPRRPSCAPA